MRKLIQAEELAIFAACLYYFPAMGYSWWWFAGCILLPDVSMMGYVMNRKTGAYLYNLFHHRGIAILLFAIGVFQQLPPVEFAGFILFSHASMDRMLNYGLKYEKGFQFTHLGMIGRNDLSETTPG